MYFSLLQDHTDIKHRNRGLSLETLTLLFQTGSDGRDPFLPLSPLLAPSHPSLGHYHACFSCSWKAAVLPLQSPAVVRGSLCHAHPSWGHSLMIADVVECIPYPSLDSVWLPLTRHSHHLTAVVLDCHSGVELLWILFFMSIWKKLKWVTESQK